jgi:hypothetical protein
LYIKASCNSALCSNGGTCVLMANGTNYKCACPPGYTGDRCTSLVNSKFVLIDRFIWSIFIDQCASQPCRNGGVCSQGPFTYDCKCPSSYRGEQCELVTSVYCKFSSVMKMKIVFKIC